MSIIKNFKNSMFYEILETLYWRTEDFFKDWIYPAYKWRRLLDPHNVVKLPRLCATEWTDVRERMYQANMELIKYFIEKEKPEEHVVWYKDDDGVDAGHRYGEGGAEILFESRKDDYIMDIIKEIYKWYVEDEPKLQQEYETLLSFWSTYCCEFNLPTSTVDDEGDFIVVSSREPPKDLSFFDDKNIDWETIDKYCDGDRANCIKKNFIFKKVNDLESMIFKKSQYYLHLCVEVRPYLWT